MKEIDEKELWIRFKEKGSDSAREDLVVHHMRIVKYIAGRMAMHMPSSVEMNDLIGWGVMGLMDAVEKFDHKQDIKFSTYASIRIRGAIIDQIRTLDWAPRSLRNMARRVGQAKEKLRHVKGGEPSADDIAAELGTTAEHVEDTITQLQTVQVLSLDDYLPGEDSADARKRDVTHNPASPSPSALAEMKERVGQVAHAILNLPDQQQKVLNLYYFEELTLKEIGLVLEVSESRVCQIHSAAMKSLRKAIQSD